ncbi:hypothetical protein [Balneola vulgaris]|uniref:hypothetical protein n=1 Tax=Balneola vulgaris TaxID=287535 RepID=UPI000363CA6C|nr:hypothetical protein [Balneola vulgaris]
MSDFSNVLQVIGAMVLVSLLVQSANRKMNANSMLLVENEFESEIAAISQEIIEESRLLAFDEATVTGFVPVDIPAGFSDIGRDLAETADKVTFDDFDDLDGWSGIVSTTLSDFNVSIEVVYIDKTTGIQTNAKTTLKEIQITITNDLVRFQNTTTLKPYYFSYIRSYYAE